MNIFLDLLIGTWTQTNNFIMGQLCGYLLIKNSFVSSNGLLKSKNIDWSYDQNITKWENLYGFTFQICYWDSVYNVI